MPGVSRDYSNGLHRGSNRDLATKNYPFSDKCIFKVVNVTSTILAFMPGQVKCWLRHTRVSASVTLGAPFGGRRRAIRRSSNGVHCHPWYTRWRW